MGEKNPSKPSLLPPMPSRVCSPNENPRRVSSTEVPKHARSMSHGACRKRARIRSNRTTSSRRAFVFVRRTFGSNEGSVPSRLARSLLVDPHGRRNTKHSKRMLPSFRCDDRDLRGRRRREGEIDRTDAKRDSLDFVPSAFSSRDPEHDPRFVSNAFGIEARGADETSSSKDEFFLRQEVGLVSSDLSLQDHHEIKRIECVMNTFDSERKRRNTHVSMPFAVRNDQDRFLSHLVRSRRHGVLAQFLRGDDRRGNVPNISERKNRRRISVIARLEMPPVQQSVMSFRNNGQESTRFREKTKTCISRPEFRSFRSRS